MKTVVFLSPKYFPATGGVEKHVAGLSQELLKKGFKVIVLTVQHQLDLPLSEDIDGVWVERIPFTKIDQKLATWRWIWSKRDILKKADIIHAHDVFWWYLPLRFWFFKKPIFTTFHGYEGGESPRWQAVVHRRVVEKLSKKTLAVGDFIKKWYGQKSDEVTYGAADGEKPSPSTARKSDQAVFIGRLEWDTGIREYLEVIKNLGQALKLDIYGEGKLKMSLLELVEDNHWPVKFCGLTKNSIKTFNQAKIAFAAQYLTILEAMLAKCLVVAIYTSPMKNDYLSFHPAAEFMLIAGSGREAAGKFLILSERKKEEMIINAYNWAKEQTWEKLAKQYLSLWQL